MDAAVGPSDVGPLDGSPGDAGPDARSDAPHDAAPPTDAWCAPLPERSLRFCVLAPTGEIPEGEPYTLPIARTLCLCGGRSCAVFAGEGRIELSLTSCESDTDCDECTTEALCELPPLTAGEHEVWIDGVLSGAVRVGPRRMVSEARPSCSAVPDSAPDTLRCTGEHTTASVTQLCHRTLEDVGSVARFTLSLACSSCDAWSAGCEAVRDSARSLVLRPRVQRCACPTCEGCDACEPATVVCETPPLRDGRYEVLLEDAAGVRTAVSTLEVEDVMAPGPTRCVALP